jgi:hypothetical protein
LNVTPNLQSALLHLRFEDQPRLLWADSVWYVYNFMYFLSY